MPPPDESDEDERAAAGVPEAAQTPAGMTLNEQLTYIMNQVQRIRLEVTRLITERALVAKQKLKMNL